MKRGIVAVGLAIGIVLGVAAVPAGATWVSTNCKGSYVTDYYVKRSEAQAYAALADKEGYEWGGGCWNDNNKDDTPNAPDSSGEGPDCSGFTFKTWEMVDELHKSGFTYYDRIYNVHGPYVTSDFHAPESADPFYKLANKKVSTTIYMDAFAKDGHVAMLYTDSGSPLSLDLMIEALGDDYGTGKFWEGYRDQSEYVGVRREDWTDDCWPSCAHPIPSLVVVP